MRISEIADLRGVSVFLVLAGLTTVAGSRGALASPAAPTADEVCAMLSEADASSALGKPVKATPSDMNHLGSMCKYRGPEVFLQVRVETDDLLKQQKNGSSAADRFAVVKKEVDAKRGVSVPGVGEDAIWASNMLWVLKNKKVLVISIDGAHFKPEADPKRAKAVAAKVLQKL